jgi:fucose 4-O-acetylase-like acetyltransferase
MNVRNIALDYAKGLGILIVVFAHLWRGLAGAGVLTAVNPDLVALVSSTCTILSMPTFFMVSGSLYGSAMVRRHGRIEFFGKFDAIFYPYVIWSVAIGLFEVLGAGLRNHGASVVDMLDILWNPHGIFWFLYALLLAFALIEVMIFVLGVDLSKKLAIPIGLLLLILYPYAPKIACLPELCMSFVYFALGVFLAEKIPQTQRPSWSMGVLLLLALIIVEYVAHEVLDGGTHSFRSITPNAVVTAVVSLSLLMCFCYCLPNSGFNIIARLGERSMDIYLVHLLFVAFTRILLNKLFDVKCVWVYLLAGMSMGVVGSLLLVSYMKKGPLVYMFRPPSFLSAKNWLSVHIQKKSL